MSIRCWKPFVYGDNLSEPRQSGVRCFFTGNRAPIQGGDEFAVLLPETNLGGAQNVSRKLRRALIAFGQQISPIVPPLTFCGGISQLREADSSIDDMLARADSAQYLAKDMGKDDTRTELDLESARRLDP